ncbi:hypothetical protein L1987_39327 [Smallanthus sonchifolius]|uniref:Uncharacterized protein n=1 Tax=Smallanthus sonchifolius TaxID=185202 RepID=A0ACB9HMK1_9ASTR|nr:hypothetical protein L1987_39327 [Smallanthus sonchifolius]
MIKSGHGYVLLHQLVNGSIGDGVLHQVKASGTGGGDDGLTGTSRRLLQCGFLRIWRYYMAEKEVRSEVSVNLARESLIALSYSLPDPDLSSTDLPKGAQNATEAVNTDEKEKVRSDLISIAYTEPPDTKGSPVSPKETNGT